MRKNIPILIAFFIASCGAPAGTPPAAVEFVAPQVLASPTIIQPTETATQSAEPSPTLPLPTMSGPTPTETSLPPLELPTEAPSAPSLLAWDGRPTYPGDSNPNYYFRLKYDPEVWALTTDNFGSPAIGHRAIEYCVITPSVGRGLPANMNVDHDVRRVGAVEYEVNTASLNGVKQFVTYTGGDANVYTGFEVTFKDEVDLCIQDSEIVLATLTSVPISQATPIP